MNMIQVSRYVFALLFFFLTAFSGCRMAGDNNGEYYRVTKVVDGDTFWIDDGSEKGTKVRLIGLDAPETRKSGHKDIGYYGEEAKVYLTRLLLNKEVRLEYDVDRRDRYGRTLAYAWLKDGTFVNAELIRLGYGVVLTIPPNVRFADEFAELQKEARKSARGLWGK